MTSNFSTGGAVAVKNDKGQVSMKKVKVTRYVAGKRPDYARYPSDEEEDEEENEVSFETPHHDNRQGSVSDWLSNQRASTTNQDEDDEDHALEDRRLRRLQERKIEATEERERLAQHRRVMDPEVLLEDDEQDEKSAEEVEEDDDDDDDRMDLEDEEEEKRERDANIGNRRIIAPRIVQNEDDEDRDENDEEIARRRQMLRQRLLEREAQSEAMTGEEEQKEEEKEEEEEEEEESEDEDEESDLSESDDDTAPRLKPVFVRKSDRVTIKEKEMETERQKEIDEEKMRLQEQSKRHTKKIIEEELKKERMAEKETDDKIVCEFDTDDEDENETEFDAWKLRELKRIKRDRDEKEAREKEKEDIIRLRNMTEEERLAELEANPKQVTNLREKGKYKYLQKYYHRGAFFMHEEQAIYKRDISAPTLEDHFDKSILPKVMQVKNFGMAGRTKYTHLLDQDTTKGEENPLKQTDKPFEKVGGNKQVFEKSGAKKRK